MVESTAPVRTEADDFSVKHGIHAADGVREFDTEVWPGLEYVTASRNEAAVVPFNVGERAKAVVLHLEMKSG